MSAEEEPTELDDFAVPETQALMEQAIRDGNVEVAKDWLTIQRGYK